MKTKALARAMCVAGAALATVTGAQAGQEREASDKPREQQAPSEPYVDRLIGGGTLAPLIGDDGDEDYVTDGLPRYWRAEAVASRTGSGGDYRNENGVVFAGRVETLNFGALSVDGVARSTPRGGSISVIQRGMPFDGGWLANNGVGTLYTPTIDLARSQYRFYLPTFPVEGGSSEWVKTNAAQPVYLQQNDVQLQIGAGQPGLFDGLRLTGFSRLGGSIATGGAQWNASPNWQAGLQLVDAHGVATAPRSGALAGSSFGGFNGFGNGTTGEIDARSAYGSVAWHDAIHRLQVNLVQSENNQGPSARGLWVDGQSRQGAVNHNYGAFRLDPNLTWGYAQISSDVEGAYYRANYHTQQWLVDGGVDAVRSISGAGLNGFLFTGNARYQFSRALGAGGGATYRRSGTDASAQYAFVERANGYGIGCAQLDTSTENNDKLARVSVDQTWSLPVGSRLTTAVSVGRQTINGRRQTFTGFSVAGGGDLMRNLTWDGSVSANAVNGASATRGAYANIGVTARLSSHWSLSANYFDNRNEDRNLLPITPLIPVTSTALVTRSRAFFFTLRYEDRAGTLNVPLGGASGRGAGSISGHLFLDANDNGLFDASEQGAPNVTVLLDGRFATRTDAQGRYEFPFVASGTHAITVVPDNLPLPWTVGGAAKRLVTVKTRETAVFDIEITRIK